MSGRAGAVFTCLALLLVFEQALPAQLAAPERPRLAAGVDTNSATSYYQYGVDVIAASPRAAADAFHWASRLAPGWADPYHARATALVLADRTHVVHYVLGDPDVRDRAEAAAIDSLYHSAYVRNPFIASRLDVMVLEEFLAQVNGAAGARRAHGGRTDAAFAARMAFLHGDHAAAANLYAAAIERSPSDAALHRERARVFAALAEPDSALEEMRRALAKLAQRHAHIIERQFRPAAIFEHSVAQLHLQRGDDRGARAAYERAVATDFSFYAAHAALGALALQQGDTATAEREYALAVELRPEDGNLRVGYALALIQANRQADAAAELQRAIALEPYYAQPYYLLGRILDHAGFTAEAGMKYEAFLQRAALSAPEREWVKERVRQLGARSQ